MATGAQDDLMKQAQHMWSMLDELAETDVDAYKKFIQTNLQQGKKELALAKPWMCVKTRILKPYKATLYINICSWSRIDKPRTSTDPIKVTAGPVQDGHDETGTFKVVRVAFNPDVLEECSKRSEEKDMLIGNAIDYLKDEKKLHLSSSYHICDDIRFKGDPMDLGDFFCSGVRARQKVEEEQSARNLSKLTPDLLLSQLKVSDDQLGATTVSPDVTLHSSLKSDKLKGGLIQEISSQDVGLKCPEYDVRLKEADAKRQQRLVVRILLPGVHSVADCELNITQEELSLTVADKFELHLPLPEAIREDDSTAKFNSKTSSLTVAMPTRTFES
ncbi:PIH1 domain-containing protein 2-like [Acanthaster planci]|uniref:PIH1 domain-containing protein 2 n=1 Tax=Acanthaster planci TaxID=133434 RepID=A0A8B7YW79_ACAPL|nr:PIH1 domain-containing protein 2-like [Acanthaster planci]